MLDKPRRRWFQFSLRTLFALLLVLVRSLVQESRQRELKTLFPEAHAELMPP
jgi:hypothetical protein